jgi:DNA-binding transcriptional ArsR family regulator
MGGLEDLRKQLKGRSQELEPLVAEYDDIQEALKVLDTSVRKTSRWAARVASDTRTYGGHASKGHRAGRGERPEQFVKIVQESPGLTVSEIAKRIGVHPSGLYTTAKKLSDEGAVKKSRDNRYTLKS